MNWMYVQVDKRSENVTMEAKSAALRIEKNGRKNKKKKNIWIAI